MKKEEKMSLEERFMIEDVKFASGGYPKDSKTNIWIFIIIVFILTAVSLAPLIFLK